ncbi:MAG: DNA-formamidopyrimidine glycosylase family protein [Phycisphaerales bacterium]|nr:DNA-formamidopyrimidine glycosylase family protein [Phycisphaerales bacterium]
MPELPEVERGRRMTTAVAKGRIISRVRCADDRIVIEDAAPRTLAKKLTGRRVIDVHRHGKQLWFELDQPPMPLFHYGMTGAFHVPGGEHLELESGIDPGTSWPPRFWKIQLEFEDGGKLAMTSARRLGRIRLRNDPRHEPPISRLGFDPLQNMPSPKAFAVLLAGRRVTLKGLLLDQSFAAGVGNWIADEVLYQSGLDPRRRVDSLATDEIHAMHHCLKRIIRTSVGANADKGRLPNSWLFHERWGRDAEATTHDGERIEHLTIAGRTTAWVPARQH